MPDVRGEAGPSMIRTQATPEQIAAFRAGLMAPSGKHADASKRIFVSGFARRDDSDWLVQLPLFVETKQVNGHWRTAHNTTSTLKYDVLDELTRLAQLADERDRVSFVQFTRIAPGKLDRDNVPGAFKHVMDMTCVFLVEGLEARKRLWLTRKGEKRVLGKDIGHFDNKLIGTGKVTCEYAQTQHENDRRKYGIRIRLRLRPR